MKIHSLKEADLMKRVNASYFTVCVLCVVSIAIATPTWQGSGTITDPYQIDEPRNFDP